MKLYFAYGANLNKSNMSLRCPDAVQVQPWYLQDYRLSFSGVATIQPRLHSRVPGALWAISEQDEAALDVFEGYPTLYRKEIIGQDGLEFMVYVMNSDEPWEPSVSYLSTIAEGYGDWSLPLEDLWASVRQTTLETNYDMQWSPTHGTGLDPSDEELVSLESGHDLRWIRHVRTAD